MNEDQKRVKEVLQAGPQLQEGTVNEDQKRVKEVLQAGPQLQEPPVEAQLNGMGQALMSHKQALMQHDAMLHGLELRLQLLVEYLAEFGLHRDGNTVKLSVNQLMVFSETRVQQIQKQAQEQAEVRKKVQQQMAEKKAKEEEEEKEKKAKFLEQEREKLRQEQTETPAPTPVPGLAIEQG